MRTLASLASLTFCVGILGCEEPVKGPTPQPKAEATVNGAATQPASETETGADHRKSAARSWSDFLRRRASGQKLAAKGHEHAHNAGHHYRSRAAHRVGTVGYGLRTAALPYGYNSTSRSYDLGGEDQRQGYGQYDYESGLSVPPNHYRHRRHHRAYRPGRGRQSGIGLEYANAPMSINSPEYFDPWAGYGTMCPYAED